ncbi:MAG TPA: Rne/Rng family ribonuclease [Nitrospirales bacterium]|nr:Rne/Rng family ribonuclease [Nitrospirales bacterium]
MATEIIINVMPEETRVALLENKVVTEVYIDRKKKRDLVGNIYVGKVVKTLPGMQAAFIDIGLDRAAFLHASDIFPSDPAETMVEPEESVELEEEEADEGEEESEKASRLRRRSRTPIEELLQQGQDIMVQVSKGPLGTKGPRVTSYVSLPGRHLVLMPGVNHVGISRRIEGEEERSRLKDLMIRLREPGAGYIVRTVSAGIREEDLASDMQFLRLLWKDILRRKTRATPPCLLHTDLDLSFRIVRDLFSKKVNRLLVDSKEEYSAINEFVRRYLPDLATRVHLYEKSNMIFDDFGVEAEISKALGRKVWLKSGGSIIIDHAEALTVIDVNTGRFVGKRDIEETIFKTNMEAAKEVACQLRFRNIGGIIVIDFIDMESEKHRDKVYQTFVDALSADRARMRVLRISELGVIEMSRERVREGLLRTLCEPCVSCEGKGVLKSRTTICYEIFREIRRLGLGSNGKRVVIGAHDSVVDMLSDEEYQGIEDLERDLKKQILVKADPTLHWEQYDIVVM